MGRSAGAILIDENLVVRSQAGDAEAIAELAGQVRPLVHRYATRFFSDPGRAEDLAQTALMKAFSRVGDVRSPEAFHAWLLRITRNECLNELARQRHAQIPLSTLDDQGTAIEAPPGGEDDPEESLVRGQIQSLVWRVAASLPEHYRRTLTMRALEDRTYEEISAELEIPVTVARLWYCRARKRFRKAFVELMVGRRGVTGVCLDMGVEIAGMIEGTLSRAERDRVQHHLADCSVCRQTEDELRSTAFRAPSRALLLGLGLLRFGTSMRRAAATPVRRAARTSLRLHNPAVRLLAAGAGGVSLAAAGAAPVLLSTPNAHTVLAASPGDVGAGHGARHDAGVVTVSAGVPAAVTTSDGAPSTAVQTAAAGVTLAGVPVAATLAASVDDLQPTRLMAAVTQVVTGTLRTVSGTSGAVARSLTSATSGTVVLVTSTAAAATTPAPATPTPAPPTEP